MSATIQIGRYKATVSDLVWSSDNKDLERLLNESVDMWARSPSVPDPDFYAATKAVAAHGGKVVAFDPVEHETDAIY